MQLKNISKALLLIFLPAIVAVTTPAFADVNSNPDSSHSWHFMIAPYGWLPSVKGNVTIHNSNYDFNIPFRDILKHLDGGAELHVEGGYDRWSFMIDPTYLKLSKDINVGPVHATITSKTLLTDMGVFYRVLSCDLPKNQYFSFELLGGGRDLAVDNSIDFNSGLSFATRSQFLAPIVGVRLKYDLNRAKFWLRGDVGGFGIDHITNTWSGIAGLAYAANTHIDLAIAYRVLKIDINETHSAMNVWLYGPIIGVSFHS